MRIKLLFALLLILTTCVNAPVNKSASNAPEANIHAAPAGMPNIDSNSAIYEVAVNDGVSYQDVIDSLKSVSEGMNFVNPANFPIGDYIKQRGIDPQGIKAVHSFCNLTMGTDIFLDHPEFLVFAPCRVALYEKPDENKKFKLFIGLARPTYDLKSIKNPSERAKKSAQQLEDALIALMDKARKGDI
jgi:uncharacterized protein (DUF302 family)